MGEVAPCDGPNPSDAWGRLRFTPTGGWQLLQRREAVRADHRARVRFNHIDTPNNLISCMTVDVSGGGLLVDGLSGRAQIGDEFAFELLPVPGEEPICGHCRVTRETEKGRMGVEFTFITNADRDRLVTFAHRARERQRLDANLAVAA
jgi:c-di-GMP-binding flagellar brake protein YcgR